MGSAAFWWGLKHQQQREKNYKKSWNKPYWPCVIDPYVLSCTLQIECFTALPLSMSSLQFPRPAWNFHSRHQILVKVFPNFPILGGCNSVVTPVQGGDSQFRVCVGCHSILCCPAGSIDFPEPWGLGLSRLEPLILAVVRSQSLGAFHFYESIFHPFMIYI